MEYRIDIDPTSGWGRVTVTGEVALEGLAQLLKAAWTDPEYSRIETALWNFLDARTSMRLEDLMQLKAWISGAKGDRGARTIALVAADDVIFGVGRMFHAVQPEVGWKVSIFREESEAIAWLKAQEDRSGS